MNQQSADYDDIWVDEWDSANTQPQTSSYNSNNSANYSERSSWRQSNERQDNRENFSYSEHRREFRPKKNFGHSSNEQSMSSDRYSGEHDDRYSGEHDYRGQQPNRNSSWRDDSQRERRPNNEFKAGNNSDNTLRFFISSSQVGRVIGRKGAKINEFIEQSGAKIHVDSNTVNDHDEVEIVVRGADDCCHKAKDLIENFVGNFSGLQIRDNSKSGNNYSENKSTYDSSENEEFDWENLKKCAAEHEKKKFLGLPPIKKYFYSEDPEVASCSEEKVAKLRAERNNITVMRSEDDSLPIPNPVWTFEHAFQKHPEILEELRKQGFTAPSPIQCQAWPVLLSGKDMIGIAQTGTGKTIAFLLPAFIHIEHQVTPREKRPGPSCLVLAPTRELALQIYDEALKYSYRNIKCVCIYGGGSRRDQIKVVTKGVEIVIATPGRLVDLIRAEIINLKGVSYMVLDEADRMLDMGFEPDVKYIMSFVRPDRQMVLTSATWPDAVAHLVKKYMDKPNTVNVGCLDLAAVHTVEQQFYFISDHDQKRQLVFDFIANMQPEDKVIIFVDRKAVVDDVASDIQMNDTHCASLHGDRCQEDREQALLDFKDSSTRILVATDLASRGLDVKDVTHVFNMCMPKNLEDYVHRIGRTGRAGRNGIAISIIDRQDWGIAKKLIRILEESGNYVPHELVSMAERYEKKKQEQQASGQFKFRGPRRY